jgi:hypothetical protein
MVGTFTSSVDESPTSARAGDEIVASEQVAADLLRLRAADVIETIESEDDQAAG